MREKLLDLMKNEGLKPSQLAELLGIYSLFLSNLVIFFLIISIFYKYKYFFFLIIYLLFF